jgi:hypothetical protein
MLARTVSRQYLGTEIPPDGLPHPIPPTGPSLATVVATDTAIALAMGPDRAARARDALLGSPVPAPLAWMSIDYRKLGPVPVRSTDPDEVELQHLLMSMLTTITAQLSIDDRGLVLWSTFALR